MGKCIFEDVCDKSWCRLYSFECVDEQLYTPKTSNEQSKARCSQCDNWGCSHRNLKTDNCDLEKYETHITNNNGILIMKELSVEEKAKAYDDALERYKAKRAYESKEIHEFIEYLFPELAESEDERIRKRLLELFKGHWSKEWYGLKVKDVIAWLEKQGEHNNFRNKIQIGDKVTRNEDGVLVNLSQLKRVAKKGIKQGEQKPAFEMKTPEESLGIDSDTYNKIVDEYIYGDDKPAWSEEDEKEVAVLEAYIRSRDLSERHIDRALSIVDELVKKLKSIRPQNTWKPSDEQMKILNEVLSFAANHESPYWNDYIFGTLSYLIRQLKKL